MKKIMFNIRTYEGKLEQQQGYAFYLEGLRFAIRKRIANVCQWTVTELTSGAVFYEGNEGETRKACIQSTKDRLEKYGLAECKRIIAAYIAKHAKPDTGEANKCEN